MAGVSLKGFNTFGIDCKADRYIPLRTKEEAISLLGSGEFADIPRLIMGGGSNLLFLSDFKGTIIHPLIGGIEIISENENSIIVKAGAGINWDDLVQWSVDNDLGGLENLSLIPGNVGAVPVQNIGAYGAEAAGVVESVEAISLTDGKTRYFNNKDCSFGYRDSVFKKVFKNKYLITSVTFRLEKNPVLKTGYGSVYDEAVKIGGVTLRNIRQAIINIRSSKLPDPAVLGNAGSFFKNPVIPVKQADELKATYPQMPQYDDKAGMKKIAAGWMIESCGWKGKKIGDAGVHDQQALVLVNFKNATGREIYELSTKIEVSVYEKFGIRLEREVEIIGTI